MSGSHDSGPTFDEQAQLLAWRAELGSISCQLDAMNADSIAMQMANVVCDRSGAALAYGEEHFDANAKAVTLLARRARDLAERIRKTIGSKT